MRVVVVGAGGHARSVIDALRTSSGGFEPVACTDPDPKLAGAAIDGVPVIGGDERLEQLVGDGIVAACVGVGGVGDNGPRAGLYGRLVSAGFNLPSVIHGTAYVASSAQLGPGTVVLAGALVAVGASVGENVIVNTGAVVEHDCVIADHVHLATGCQLGGGVTVDTMGHVGLGASVLQKRRVGARAIVGAGAVVVGDVAAGQTVVGAPAAARATHSPGSVARG